MNNNLGLLLYENVQPMDVIGPWEVLSFWKNILKAPINLYLVAENGGFISCDNDIILKAHCDFKHCPPLDYLIVPGGRGRLAQVNNDRLITFIKQQAKNCRYIISICTGMFLLHKAGLLKEKTTTTYWRAMPELKTFTDVHVIEDRVVKCGNIWASGGVSSGIDLALELIAEIAGKEIAGQVQLLIEYFPSNKVYCSMKTADALPPYLGNADSNNPDLPEYIKNYIKTKNTD